MKLHRHLHHAIVPHPGNHHRPHLIRPIALAVIALLIAVQQMTLTAVAHHVHGSVLAYASDITPVEILQDTNAERVKAGLAPLQMNAKLNAAAAAKAADMFQYDYWAHVSPSGIQPWYWFEQAGYKYAYAGENLAKDFDTAAGVTAGWMNSPEHKANILNSHYIDIGVAVVNGTLQGHPTTLVVAHYGAILAPAPVVAVVKPVATPTPVPAPVVAKAQPTPAPTPVPTIVPTPIPTPIPVQMTPAPTQYSAFTMLPASSTLSASSKISLAVVAILLLIMIWSHSAVWRRRIIHGYTHGYRARVAAEFALIAFGATIIIVRSFGAVS